MNSELYIAGDPHGEVSRIAKEIGIETCQIARTDLCDLPEGASLFLCHSDYPELQPYRDDEWHQLTRLASDGGRVFCEYDFHGNGPVERLRYERIVVSRTDHPVTSAFAPLDLLAPHRAYVHRPSLPDGTKRLLVAGKVSGFDRAVFGFPERLVPILVLLPTDTGDNVEATRTPILYSTTSISSPLHRRYKPAGRWQRLVASILIFLTTDDGRTKRDGTTRRRAWPISSVPTSRANTAIDLPRPVEEYRRSARANIDWYRNGSMLVEADGSAGVYEGYHSEIEIDGSQRLMLHEGVPSERADCNMQSAVAFAAAGEFTGDPTITEIGSNLLTFSRENFFCDDLSVYGGLWRWFRNGYESTVFYSDDNGWCGFLSLLCGVSMNDDRLLRAGLDTATALKQTWGANGHRRTRIDLPHFYELGGRKGLREESPDKQRFRSPHYEAPSMALLGLTSLVSGDLSYAQTAVRGADDYLLRWPEEIMFQHSENDDTSKFIVALLFLGAALDRNDLLVSAERLLSTFIDAQLECGAIPDIDRLDRRYGKNLSNDDYGTFESSLFQTRQDVVTDQVYGSSFMLWALYFFNQFRDSARVEKAMHALAGYLTAIQLADTGRPYLDGAWLRAFDPVRWEYYGSAGDWGYGPYLIETGWCQAVITAALSWIGSDTRLPDFADPSVQRRAQILLPEVIDRHNRIEVEWRDHTPEAKPRQFYVRAGTTDETGGG